jgi:hypothetical protein
MYMYLVRKVDGQPWKTFQIDPNCRRSGRNMLRKPRVWRFIPILGGEKYRENQTPSKLCKAGFAAIADTETEARNMIDAYRRTFKV